MLTKEQKAALEAQQREVGMHLLNSKDTESEEFKAATKAYTDIRTLLSDSPPPEQSMEARSGAPDWNPRGWSDEEYYNMKQGMQSSDDYVTGVVQGGKNAVQFGEDLVRRGVDSIFGSDTLSSLNERRAGQFADTFDAQERSPTAFGAGQVTGELVATLPIGGVGGVGGKAVGSHVAANFLKAPVAMEAGATKFALDRAAMQAADHAAKTRVAVGVGTLAGEGAAIGGYSTYGGLDDRLIGAAQGAATDLVGGTLLSKATKAVGANVRRRSTDGPAPLMDAGEVYHRPGYGVTSKADPAERGAFPDNPAEVLDQPGQYGKADIDAGIGAARTNQMDRIAEAREFGGVDIDSYVARGDYQSLRRLQEIMADPELRVEYKNSRALQEKQKSEFATAKVGEFGTVTPEKLAAPEEGLRKFVDTIKANRTDADKAVKDSWQVYRDAAQENNITPDLNPINNRLAELSDDLAPDTVQAANETYASQLTKQLKKYQLLGGKTNTVTTPSSTPGRDAILPRLSGGKTEVVPDTSFGKPLTVDNYHDLISDINGTGNFASMTPNERVLRKKVLKALDEGIDEAMRLGGADDAVIELGRKARREQASFNDQWSRGDIVDRLTSTKKTDDETFQLDYSKALDGITLTDLKKLHRSVGLDANNPAWQSLQQVKLLKALKAGMASDKEATETLAASMLDDIPSDGSNFSVNAFNYKAFFKEIESIDRTMRVELWGEAATANFEKMHKVLGDSVKRPSASGSANTSGTALALIDSGRYAGRGTYRDVFMGLHSAAPKLFMKAKHGSRADALSASFAGEMDDLSKKELEAAIAYNLEQNFQSYTDFAPSDIMSEFTRRLFTTSVVSDHNDQSKK